MSERDLKHLTRYFVVDAYDRPHTVSPTKRRDAVDATAAYLNGRNSDHVRGVPERRPYRVVQLVPQEVSDE